MLAGGEQAGSDNAVPCTLKTTQHALVKVSRQGQWLRSQCWVVEMQPAPLMLVVQVACAPR
eukprot:15463690-Alexandrium_andersonii.AAC.1